MKRLSLILMVMVMMLAAMLMPVGARGGVKGKPAQASATPIGVPTVIEYPTWIPETPVLTPLPILGN